MKVVLVANAYHPFVGGVETHARQVAHELTARGHEVVVAAVQFQSGVKHPPRLHVLADTLLAPPFDDYQDGPVAVHALAPRGQADRLRLLPIALRATPVLQRYAFHGLTRFGYTWWRNVFYPRLRRAVEGADVVHSLAFGYPGWLAEEAARAVGAGLICTPFVHPHQWGDGQDDIRFYKRTDALVSLVDTDKEYLTTLGLPAEKIHVIGVSPELPPTSDAAGFRSRHGIDADAPLVLYVGRMMPKKGAPALVAAMPSVWEHAPKTRFVFIGPASPDEARVFEGIDGRALYLGKVSAQEKADALAACDVFCMPSISEILPTVYLEAWQNGKPVVGGTAHGLPELVEGNGAGIAAGQSAAEIGDALLRLVSDPALRERLGARGAELVRERYSVASVTGALERLYGEVAAAAKQRRRGPGRGESMDGPRERDRVAVTASAAKGSGQNG